MSFTTQFFSKDNKRQSSDCVILVEGQDDAVFLSALLDEINADPEKVGIVEVGGKENFSSRLKSFLKSPSFTQGVNKTIAIICDADGDPKKAETDINSVLTAASQPNLVLGKFVSNSKGVRFGLFTMPNPNTPGDLESLCLDTVSGHPLEIEAESFISTAEDAAKKEGRNLNGSRYKRKAQVFLAGIAKEIARGAGQGYAKGYFTVNHDALDPLKNFLKKTSD